MATWKMRRGAAATIAAVTLEEGEPAFTTDNHDLYVGTGAGNQFVGGGSGNPLTVGALGDVTISSVADNEVLAYNTATSTWLNQTPTEAGLLASDGSVGLTGALTAASTYHLELETVTDTRTVRLNSRSFTATSGDFIGFQSKPSATVNGTATVYGCQVSPRFADAVGGDSLVGVQAAPILKGTSGTLTGDVRAVQAEITDENVAGRTVDGTVSAFWCWHQLAAHTFTGGVYALHVIGAGGGTPWTGLMKLPDEAGIADKDADQAIANLTTAGYIKLNVGGQTRYIWLASNAPTGP